MATYGWGTDHSVATGLFTAGHRFDFYQAVRLLELLQPASLAVGESAEPHKEAVRFKSRVSLAFPATDVAAVQPPGSPGMPAEMTVNFMGLAGGLGPLPAPYTELILERAWRQDTALGDFLDIFNHRLVSLLYRVRKKHRLGLAGLSPERDAFAGHLFALLGLGTRGVRERLLVKDRTVLFYAGLLTQQPRSITGLEAMLADYFGVPVQGWQFCGRWRSLEADQVTTLGVSGQNRRLGDSVVLGTRLWDQYGAFELRLGPLTLPQFGTFLPIGQGFDALCELTRFYVRGAFDFTVRLLLRAAEVPTAQLSREHGSRLGWTTWLHTRTGHASDAQVCLTPSAVPSDLQKVRIPLFAELPRTVLSEVVRQMTLRQFPPHAVVVRQGTPGSSLFVIRRGGVKVIQHEASGHEVLLATLHAGDYFGEVSFLTGKPRTATVITIDKAEIFEVSRQQFDAILARYPGAGIAHQFDARGARDMPHAV
jgi:type VI secretion system protein ImpH